MPELPAPEPVPVPDLPVPLFDTYQVAAYRGGKIFRGPLNPYYEANPGELSRVLKSIPGDHDCERIDGRAYLTLNVYSPSDRPRYGLHILLFVLTLLTTTASGAAQAVAGPVPFEEVLQVVLGFLNAAIALVMDALVLVIRWFFHEIPEGFPSYWSWFSEMAKPFVSASKVMATGLSFSLTLLAILGAHELSHYFASRRRGIRCTLPYFIPLPFLIGTLGAIIRVKSPFVHRRSLLEVGIAGPLASFVLSTAAIVYGLVAEAKIGPPMANRTQEVIFINDSLLTWAGIQCIVRPPTPDANVIVGPVFWAGWIGLFVTMLNILPLGQLDGGHVWYAMSEKLHRRLQRVLVVAMVVAGVVGAAMTAADMLVRYHFEHYRWLAPFAHANPPVWPGWLLMAFMVIFFIKSEHPPLLDSSVRLGGWRLVLAIVGILILILTFLPNPFTILPPLPPIPPGGQWV